VRVHTMAQGGFDVSSGTGAKVSVAGGGGDQEGFIIKREDGFIVIRCLSGGIGFGQPGIGAGGAVGVAAFNGKVNVNGTKWVTEGTTLKLKIERDEHGQDDFSEIRSFLRKLLAEELPTTEEWARYGSDWYLTYKNGWHARVAGTLEAVVGAAVDTPIGTASAGASVNAGLEDRHRMRYGEHVNANGTDYVAKTTDMTILSAAAGLGVSAGYQSAAPVSEFGAAAVEEKTVAGISGGSFGMKYANIAQYEWDFDYLVDIGPVSSVEQALDELPPGMAARLKPLLDRETTLENGRKIRFREAVEQLLKIMRHNDGFLVQWIMRPEVKKEVERRRRRMALIEQQRMLPTLEALRDKERNPVKKREFDRQYRALDTELADHKSFMRDAKDPKNLIFFEPAAVYIMPLLFQWDETTVLNILGMLKTIHIGVRLQDDNCAWVPTPKEDAATSLPA